MNTIVEEIYQTSKQNPERLCIADIDNSLSYSDMWLEIKHVAKCLEIINVKKGDCIIGHCEQSHRFMVFNFACNLIGAIFVPVESKATDEFMEKVITDVKAEVILTNTYENEKKRCLSYDALWKVTSKTEIADSHFAFPDLDDVAEILFTTGTTGTSKGIMLTHGSNVAMAQNIAEGVHMKEGNVELLPLPLSHSHGLQWIYPLWQCQCCYL